MLDYCSVYILNSTKSDSIFSFTYEFFSPESKITIILELDSTMIELTKVPIKDFKLDLIKKYDKQIPIYLVFSSTYFLSKKDFGTDLYTCEYIKSNLTQDPIFTIEMSESNRQYSKYKIGYDIQIINKDMLIYLLEWIFIKN
jgi:hypothetical protein